MGHSIKWTFLFLLWFCLDFKVSCMEEDATNEQLASCLIYSWKWWNIHANKTRNFVAAPESALIFIIFLESGKRHTIFNKGWRMSWTPIEFAIHQKYRVQQSKINRGKTLFGWLNAMNLKTCHSQYATSFSCQLFGPLNHGLFINGVCFLNSGFF